MLGKSKSLSLLGAHAVYSLIPPCCCTTTWNVFHFFLNLELWSLLVQEERHSQLDHYDIQYRRMRIIRFGRENFRIDLKTNKAD